MKGKEFEMVHQQGSEMECFVCGYVSDLHRRGKCADRCHGNGRVRVKGYVFEMIQHQEREAGSFEC